MRAAESFDSAMDLDMLIQIRSLSEAESAVRKRADVGSLVGVNAQVVKKVVPLSEVLATLVMVAF